MEKVLYVSNIEVPYRTEFFNQLSEKCDLTVLYERKKSKNRDEKWSKSNIKKYNTILLNGININNEYTIDIRILKHVFSKKYNKIIIGCYNSPSQILAIIFMKLLNRKYIINLDGEYFFEEKNLKSKVKQLLLKGANGYLVAGEKIADKIKQRFGYRNVHCYHFSSITKKEIENNARHMNKNKNNKILIVGQYFDYKGLDIVLDVAKIDKSNTYRFIGLGNRTDIFLNLANKKEIQNIETVPFLSKEKLYKEYQDCKLFVLPSRKECWGLVINEAASFGCPIVSTYGSGAAVEFLKDEYSEFLAIPNNAYDLYKKIQLLINSEGINEYKKYLINKSKKYNIENTVLETVDLINDKI